MVNYQDGSVASHSSFDAGLRLVELHAGREKHPTEFELLGLRWILLPEVFAPTHTASTALFSEWMPYPVGGRFLEVGCGAGVTSVIAALRGCAAVTAVDIDPIAVRNAELNAARHGVTDRVRVLRSDLFDALDPQEKFDVIFWNSNVIPASDQFAYTRPLQRAIFDRGYRAHSRYLRQGAARLTGSGQLLLGFNSLGDLAQLHALATDAGSRVVEREHQTRQAGDIPVTFQLLEIINDISVRGVS